MKIRYQNTPRDLTRIYQFSATSKISAARTQHYTRAVFLSLLFAIGAYGCLPDQPFIASLMIAGGFMFARANYKAGRHFLKLMRNASPAGPRRDIELEVLDKGLLERASGVESFAPWDSILRHLVVDDALLIELRSGGWAVIPKSTVDDQSALLTLIKTLEEQGGTANRAERDGRP